MGKRKEKKIIKSRGILGKSRRRRKNKKRLKNVEEEKEKNGKVEKKMADR